MLYLSTTTKELVRINTADGTAVSVADTQELIEGLALTEGLLYGITATNKVVRINVTDQSDPVTPVNFLVDYSSTVLIDDPTLFYQFHESVNATSVIDAVDGRIGDLVDGAHVSGNGLLVTDGNPSDANDNSAEFDGVNDRIRIPYAEELNPKSFTVEAWVKTTGGSGFRTPVWSRTESNHANGRSGFNFYLNDAGIWEFWTAQDPVESSEWHISEGPAADLNRWTHLVGTYDKDTGTKKFYVDGKLEATETELSFVRNTVASLQIGSAFTNTGTLYFQGNIDEVAIYATALPAERISAHFSAASVVDLDAVRNTKGVAGISSRGELKSWSISLATEHDLPEASVAVTIPGDIDDDGRDDVLIGVNGLVLETVPADNDRNFLWQVSQDGLTRTSTFSKGPEGWEITRGTGIISQSGFRTHRNSGGSPGGYLQLTDWPVAMSTPLGVRAPVHFLGDLSGYAGGAISFDAIRFTDEFGGPRELFGQVELRNGSGSTVTIDVAPHSQVPSGDYWHTFSAELTETNAGLSTAAWQTFLQDVTQIEVTVEHFSNQEVVGFDNFQLTTNLADTTPLIANRGDLRTFAVGDLDSDGFDDFAVSQTTASGNELTRYSGQTLEVAGQVNGSSSTSSLAYTSATTADLNGDGRPDLIATRTNPGSENSVEVYYQDPSGGFSQFNAESISAESIDDDFGILPLTPGIDLNRDGREDLLVTAPGYDGTGDDIGKAYVVYGGLGQSSANLNSFEVLANHTISGSGDFLVDRGTGRPAEFRNLPVSDENRLFRFTLLGDAEAGDVVRVLTDGATETIRNHDSGFLVREETIAAALLDEQGGIIEKHGNQFDLRGLAAGTYFLHLFNAEGGSIPADTTVTITAAAPLAGERRSATDRDVLRGGDGDDTLTGGGELDRLFGESGKDEFVSNRVEIFDREDDESRNATTMSDDVSNVAFSDEAPITFVDQNLKDRLAEAVRKPTGSDLFPDDLKNLIELDLSETGLSDLTGLEEATNLRALNLADNQLMTLKPAEGTGLHGLTKLEYLAIDNNPLTSLEGIEESPFLKRLSLDGVTTLESSGLDALKLLQFIGHLSSTGVDFSNVEPVLGHVARIGYTITVDASGPDSEPLTVDLPRGTLTLHSGRFGFRRVSQTEATNETFSIAATEINPDGTVTLEVTASLNGTLVTQSFENVSQIAFDGGTGSDILHVGRQVKISEGLN
ncbi:MAG: LamG-like jellyroll fold domain-containing protein, partial [Planctomycetota bacterium]